MSFNLRLAFKNTNFLFRNALRYFVLYFLTFAKKEGRLFMARNSATRYFSEGEINALSLRARDKKTPLPLRTKAKALLLLSKGLSQKEAAQKTGLSRQTVNTLYQRFKETSLDSLESKKNPGRPSVDKDTLFHAYQQLIHTPPPNGKRWTCRALAEQLKVSPSRIHTMQKKGDLPQPPVSPPLESKNIHQRDNSYSTLETESESAPFSDKKSGPPVTLSILAKKLKLSRATVSRALHNSPQQSAATRLKVRQAARKLGYYTNPHVRTLMSHIRSSGSVDLKTTIAHINFFKKSYTQDTGDTLRQEGVFDRGKELGYRIESFDATSPKMSLERLIRILTTQGIQGIITNSFSAIPAIDQKQAVAKHLSRFSTVLVGYEHNAPPLHYARNDQFKSTQLARKTLEQHGYKKIALVMHPYLDATFHHRFSGGFNAGLSKASMRRFPPALNVKPQEKDKFLRYLEKHQPDAILSGVSYIKKWMEDENIKSPQEVGFAYLDCDPSNQEWSGIDQHDKQVGAACVDLLASLLQNNERSDTGLAKGILVSGTWTPGKTTVRQF